ncbi:MAG: nodulation protein NfeD [candidate division Zixibacteria bacterium]|nr:nodulation protein NfeD [candidate division Zixibacteria bacterium]
MRRKAFLIFFSFLLLVSVALLVLQTVRAIADDRLKTEDTILDLDTLMQKARVIRPLVYNMVVDGAIGTVTDDRMGEIIELAEENGAELIVVTLDTPGGFSKPTWTICKKILNSYVPVCVYIAPAGARAGSAGVYITYASHFAAMAPSTNIGAAHPVGGAGEKVDSVMNEKVTNDAVAQIRAAAEKRGRNAEWAEKAVRQSVSITNNEALELKVIDIIAENMDDLLTQLNGRITDIPSGKKTMDLVDARVELVKTTFKHRFLEVITSPDIAFILFSIGGLGIVLELYNPGAIFPGVIGAISLILAFYAFQTLPINYAGVALILLALILFIAEIKIVSHGLLAVGGIISFVLGGLMLVDTVDPGMRISLSLIITMAVLVSLTLLVVVYLVVKAAKRQPFIGEEGLVGKIAEVRKGGFVYVDGALWKAESSEELTEGSKVTVIAVNKLKLKVKNINT